VHQLLVAQRLDEIDVGDQLAVAVALGRGALCHRHQILRTNADHHVVAAEGVGYDGHRSASTRRSRHQREQESSGCHIEISDAGLAPYEEHA
jgi:hypothetical protein